VFSIAYAISAAVAIYWTTSNLFAIGQEIYVRKKIKNKYEDSSVDAPIEKNLKETTEVSVEKA
jgi:membrane protein insertase Oxa1/YidC/SpoIIIJ